MSSQTVTVISMLYEDDELLVFRAVDASGKRLRVRSSRDIIDAVCLGDTLVLKGMTVNDERYGAQFLADEFVRWEVPTGLLLKMLLITGQGVGEATVDRLVETFGNDELVRLLSCRDIERLSSVKQVSRTLAEICVRSWHDSAGKTSVFQFFTKHFTGKANNPKAQRIAHRVFQFYGDETITNIKHDPYIIWAFASWKDCEVLARSLEVALNDPRRLRCAVEEAMYRLYNQGHTAVSPLTLDKMLGEVLGGNNYQCQAIFEANNIESEQPGRIVIDHQGRWALPGPSIMERYVEEQLRIRIAGYIETNGRHPDQTSLFEGQGQPNVRALVDAFQLPSGHSLDLSQKEAVISVIEHDVTVISGRAGSGKTSVLYAVNDLIQRSGRSVLQVALAGKAAQRLMQATQQDANTIKALLSQIKRNPAFLDKYEMPVLHIDEASMVDLPLMYQVLKAFEGRPLKLVMIGDEAQLPPIGPGIIFHHLIEFDAVPSVRLLGNYRQGNGSGVLDVANYIRKGVWPDTFPDDVVVIECAQDDLLMHVQAIYCEHVGANDDTYIVPATKSLVANGNHRLHNHLRQEDSIVMCAPEFKVGDPVIFKKNRPKIGLVNGSIGRVVPQSPGDVVERDVRIESDGNTVKFEKKQFTPDLVIEFALEGRVPLMLDDIKSQGERHLQHAYAITCHQAQGSEFDVVIIPIVPSRLLDRSWIYTALTRAKTKVYFIGDITAAQYAVEVRGNAVDEREVGFSL